MEYYPMLVKAHGGFGYLTFLMCGCSLLLALLASFTALRPEAVIKITGIVENAAAGLLTLSGLAVWLIGPWPLTQGYAIAGLVIAVAYAVLLKRMIKPNKESAERAKAWLGYQAGLMALLVVGFGLMMAKPF